MSKQEIAKELLQKWSHVLDFNQVEKLKTGKFFMKRVQAFYQLKYFHTIYGKGY